MANETLSKGYEPADVEGRWLDYWKSHQSFTPDAAKAAAHPKDNYSIVIPPPNVTGALHMGHALNITLQDIMCRFMRQHGKTVLWVPGTDRLSVAGAEPLLVETSTGPLTPGSRATVMTLPAAVQSTR